MIFSAAIKALFKNAPKEAGRYAMQHARLELSPLEPASEGEDNKEGTLVVTDGHRLVVVPVELDEHDAEGFVSREAFDAAVKADKGRAAVSLEANGSLKLRNGATFPRPEGGEFPRWRAVMPRYKRGDEGTTTIAFNARQLAEIAAVLSPETDHVVLTVKPNDKGEYVLPFLVKGAGPGVGVLMPITIDD